MKDSHASRTFFFVALVLLVALALAACGGSDATESAAPSVSPSEAAASASAAASSSEVPLPTPTVAGTLVFARVVDDGWNADVCTINTDGTGLTPLAETAGLKEAPAWSPDGSRIVYVAYPDLYGPSVTAASIWVMNADGSGNVRLTGRGKGNSPHWSPDGRRILYVRYTGETYVGNIFVMNGDGSGARNLSDGKRSDVPLAWMPDGEILFVREGDLWSVNADGSGRSRLTNGRDIVDEGGSSALSPDGKTLAYFDSDGDRIVAVPLRGDGAPVTLLEGISSFIEYKPRVALAWTPDGQALAVTAAGTSDDLTQHGSPLLIVNADGTGLSAVPGIEEAFDPAWRPE